MGGRLNEWPVTAMSKLHRKGGDGRYSDVPAILKEGLYHAPKEEALWYGSG